MSDAGLPYYLLRNFQRKSKKKNIAIALRRPFFGGSAAFGVFKETLGAWPCCGRSPGGITMRLLAPVSEGPGYDTQITA